MNIHFFSDYDIFFNHTARKELEKIPREFVGHIIEKIKMIKDHVEALDIKKLKGYKHLERLRCGDYRIVYKIDSDKRMIDVGIIAHRSEVYEFVGKLHSFDS